MFLKRSTLIFFVALAFSGAGQCLQAQWGPAGGGLRLNGIGPRLGENVQLALEARDELGLSSDQVAQLQELAAGIEAEVTPLDADIDALRSQIMAGDVDYVTGLRQLQELQLLYDEVADPYRTGVTSILSVEQHRVLQSIMFDSWPGAGSAWAGGGAWYGRMGRNRAVGYGPGVGYGRGAGLGRGAGVWGGYGRGAAPGYGRGYARGFGRGVGRAGRGYYRWRRW
jgi:hypothetical protein